MSGLRTVRIGSSTVHLLPVVKGLKSETAAVEAAFGEVRPDAVAVSLSAEEVEGLRNLPEDYEPELSRYEEIYAEGLSRFGEVAAPPPCYVATVELADHLKVPLLPIDLDERSYTDLYCAAVSGTNLFRHSTRTWLLKRRSFRAETPQDFVRAWDRAVNGLSGFRTIEEKRTEAMASGIRAASAGHGNLLAVVECERFDDVVHALERKA